MMTDWKPIETAPKDGTVVIGYSDKEGVFPIYWSEKEYYPIGDSYTGWVNAVDFNYDDGGSWRFDANPTHWQPLPNPPQTN
jgi:hypothetical protein